MSRVNITPVAKTVPFDNTTAMLPNSPTETQSAIEELRNLVVDSSKAFTFCQYNGNAGTGRFLEFFSGISSNDAPLQVVGELTVLTIVARTTATSATCTIGFYNATPNPDTLLYTVTFSNQKEVILDSIMGLFSVPAGGQLYIKIDSGSIAKPHLYFTGQGG